MPNGRKLLIGPDEGDALINPIGGQMVRKITNADMNGAYSIHENVITAGSPGPRPHQHLDHDELFYVIDGTLTVRVGDETLTAPAGSFVVVPRQTTHQPSNRTAAPVHVLLLFSPGGMDSFFHEAAEHRLPLQKEPDDPQVIEALELFCQKYGYLFAEFEHGE